MKQRIVIPMHYKTGGLSILIAGIEEFLERNTYKSLHLGNKIGIEKEDLLDEFEV